MRNSSGKKEFFRASLYVWCLWYWALCDDLVVFKLWAGVIYLSFSIDTAPQWILWKRSKEDRSLRASRDGHSSSSSISPTLLMFRHLLQVQRAAVLWTFSIWSIWSFKWGLQMGAAYSSLGWAKVLYATSLVLLGTFLPIYLFTYVPSSLPIYLQEYLPSYIQIYPPTWRSRYLPTGQPTYPFTHPPTYIPTHHLPTYQIRHMEIWYYAALLCYMTDMCYHSIPSHPYFIDCHACFRNSICYLQALRCVSNNLYLHK